jgi:hypothetical protein
MRAPCIINLENISKLSNWLGKRLPVEAHRDWIDRVLLRHVLSSQDCLQASERGCRSGADGRRTYPVDSHGEIRPWPRGVPHPGERNGSLRFALCLAVGCSAVVGEQVRWKTNERLAAAGIRPAFDRTTYGADVYERAQVEGL